MRETLLLFDIEESWNVYNWYNTKLLEYVSGSMRDWGSGNQTKTITLRSKVSGKLRVVCSEFSGINPADQLSVKINGADNIFKGTTPPSGANTATRDFVVNNKLKRGDLIEYYVTAWYNSMILSLLF